jgi:multiple sugar transport system substrate-binding protein
MTTTQKFPVHQAKSGRKVGRRSFLKASRTALAVAAGSLVMPGILRAQTPAIQFWTTQRGTLQRTAYQNIIGRFEQKYPQFKVNIETMGADTLWPKLTSGLAVGQVPDLVSHLPAAPIVQLNEEGLCEPFDDVINAVGKDNFFPGALEIYMDKKRGYHMAATIVDQTTSNFWYRTDLLAEAGLEPPKYWEELVAMAGKLTKAGRYGTIWPHGKTDMGSIMALQTIWQAGGYVVNPDLSVAFNSPEVVAALEHAKEIAQFTPPGSANYEYAETINGFVTGRAASTLYTGRVLQNIDENNKAIADKFFVSAYPHHRNGRPGHTVSFSNLFIPKGSKNLEGGKLFAQWLYSEENYIEFLHSAPGHNLPVLKSVAESTRFRSHPLLQRYSKELDVIVANTASGRSILKESDSHPFNARAGEVFSSKLLVEVFHDVLIGGVPPKQAAAKGADRIAAIMKG